MQVQANDSLCERQNSIDIACEHQMESDQIYVVSAGKKFISGRFGNQLRQGNRDCQVERSQFGDCEVR